MRPTKQHIERFRQAGGEARLNQLISAVYILTSESQVLMDEAADLLQDFGMKIGEIKRAHNLFQKHADAFAHIVASMILPEQSKNFWTDYEEFDKMFRDWAVLPIDWKSNTEQSDDET